jgi:uncharacterized protein YdbL (DUF1318 family)
MEAVMRKPMFLLAASLALLAGCVTVNVYFPAAAANRAADQVIGHIIGPANADAGPAGSSSVLPAPPTSVMPRRAPLAMRALDALVPAANAASPQANLHIKSPAIETIESSMRDRYHSTLQSLLNSGAVGFTHNGDVAVHDAAKIPLAERGRVKQAVAAENADRAKLYKQIAVANGHPGWASRIREAFAKQWIRKAHAGWYYRNASGNWQQK